jgi:hypothetical protein
MMKISDPTKARRRIISLLIMLTFLVMSVTGDTCVFSALFHQDCGASRFDGIRLHGVHRGAYS